MLCLIKFYTNINMLSSTSGLYLNFKLNFMDTAKRYTRNDMIYVQCVNKDKLFFLQNIKLFYVKDINRCFFIDIIFLDTVWGLL